MSNSAQYSRPNTPTKPHKISDYDGLAHAPLATKPAIVKALNIKVNDSQDGTVAGFLHLPPPSDTPKSTTAAILLSGAGGGVVGPSSMYLSLAEKLPLFQHGITTLRLDYRFPARTKYCVRDVQAAMNMLESEYGIQKFVLVGWSFGGAPMFTVAGEDQRVIGCAGIACQTAEADGIRNLPPRPLFLLHGTDDRTLSRSCSDRLWDMYGNRGDRMMKLLDGDDHALTRNAAYAESMIGGFVLQWSSEDVGDGDPDTLYQKLVDDKERVELMKKGGDLRNESLE